MNLAQAVWISCRENKNNEENCGKQIFYLEHQIWFEWIEFTFWIWNGNTIFVKQGKI